MLQSLLAVRAFAPSLPFGEELAAFHVPFDDLVGRRGHESRVSNTAENGGMLLVIGETGHGKSGLSAHQLSIFDGHLAVRVPVSVPHPAGATTAQIPGLVLDGFANALSASDEAAAARAQYASLGRRPPPRIPEANIKGLKIAIGDLTRDRPVLRSEQLDAVHQAAQACRDGEVDPVLVLDDTDKWAGNEDRLCAGRSFFDDAASALVELGLPVVAHGHPRYFDGAGPEYFDAHVEVPRVDGEAVRTILRRRIDVASAGESTVEETFELDAVNRLVDHYEDERVSIRRVIQIASEALIEAVEAGTQRITIGAVENSLLS